MVLAEGVVSGVFVNPLKSVKTYPGKHANNLVGCSRVPAGNVGVKVYLLGTSKGVDTEELGPGRYWIGVNEELYLFPTFTQNYTWTKPDETGPEDESLSFQTAEGLVVNADVGISYHVDPNKVNNIFQKYRKGVDEITDIYLRNMVRDALVKAASSLPIESVYGKGKSELIANVEAEVKRQVESIGIVVEKIYWIGELRLPPTVVAAINEKIQATQKAQQRENEVAQAKAEAQKAVEEARGVADSTLLKARAEAASIEVKAKALRENPEVMQLEAINKWNGVLPQYLGGDAPIPFIGVDKNVEGK